MFEILGIQIWETISYNIVKQLYGTLMRMYEFLYELAEGQLLTNFVDFAGNLYIVAGLFMIFRVVIALIQMLINPDQINDKQVGAGKLLMRVVLVIVLLMVFQPNGLLLGKNGLLSRTQSALLAENGLISNLTLIEPVEKDTATDDSTTASFNDLVVNNYIEKNDISGASFNMLFYTNVYADDGVTCWFHPDVIVNGKGKNSRYRVQDGYRLTFYTTKCNGCIKIDRGDNKPFYYKSDTNVGEQYIDGNEKTYTMTYKKLNSLSQIKTAGWLLNKSWSSTSNKVKNCANWYLSYTVDNKLKLQNDPNNNVSDSVERMRGIGDYISYVKAIQDDLEGVHPEADVSGNDASKAIAGDSKEHNSITYTPQAKSFGTALVSCFQECVGHDQSTKKDCEKKKLQQFNSTGSDDIIDLMDKEDLTLSWIIAIVVGIGVLIFLVILAVDVIVRSLKLLFLELLAPIPIISYVDPKDKIFNQWLKMYFATYVSLFIKLLAIGIGITLLDQIFNSGIFDGSLFKKFLVIIAILVFMKLIPDMISKIFGIDNLGGSFKQIGGMLKTGAGIGVGAALGSTVGVATGLSAAAQASGTKNRLLAGVGALGSGLSGGLRGIGSGAKGNVLGAAKDVAGRNANRKELYASGLSPTDLIKASTFGKAGMSHAQTVDRQIQSQKDDMESLNGFTGHKGKMEETAMDSKFMKSVAQARANGFNISDDKVEELRDAWTDAQLSGSSGSEFMRQMTDSSNTPYANDYAELFNDDRFGFDMDNNFTEKGKTAALVSIMNQANSDISGSSVIRDSVGGSHSSGVSSFKELKDANTNVKNKATSIGDSVYAKTSTDEYKTSAAANKAVGISDKK